MAPAVRLLLLCSAISFFVPTLVAAITIDTVPIGNPGNAPDPETGFGAVGYNYRMGTTEVTVGQYTAFLNAVAAEDQMQLYNPWMAPSYIDLTGTIARNGAPGGYTYSILGSANHPVTFVDWGDAARFANWLHNGQPSGPQDASTTEDGAYSLLGRTSVDHLNAITRNPGATWALPTENEWYKAAYHKNDGSTNSYWDYPTATNTAPLAEAPPGGANSANYENAVLSSFFLGMADVGSYLNSTSPYGTFDQAGNLMEWTEGIASPWLDGAFARGMRGGSWAASADSLVASAGIFVNDPTLRGTDTGFRVARVPEPSSLALAIVASLVAVLGYRTARSHPHRAADRRSPVEPILLGQHGVDARGDLRRIGRGLPCLEVDQRVDALKVGRHLAR